MQRILVIGRAKYNRDFNLFQNFKTQSIPQADIAEYQRGVGLVTKIRKAFLYRSDHRHDLYIRINFY
ncbi:hypothetical protein D3C78_1779250 [compost metagenome]